jgi:hypothetical protein
MRAHKITHRSYAGRSIDELLVEFDHVGLDRDDLGRLLDSAEGRPHTGRWCIVELLVRHAAKSAR